MSTGHDEVCKCSKMRPDDASQTARILEIPTNNTVLWLPQNKKIPKDPKPEYCPVVHFVVS